MKDEQGMKYVSITFDDGREDNYTVAFPILKKLGFAATVYCTTGFIDGTWPKKDDWYSAESALNAAQIRELQDSGWEIALHGDKHVAETEDTRTALRKLAEWGVLKKPTGMSLPNSLNESGVREIMQAYVPDTISYIRGGRARDTKKLSSRILFALYTFLKIQPAYDLFNRPNVVYLQNDMPSLIPSVVVRLRDEPEMIVKFIKNLPDGAWVSLMLHSIHPDENVYKNDPWNWPVSKFQRLCSGLRALKMDGTAEILPMIDVTRLMK